MEIKKKSVGRILIGADDEGNGGLSFPVYKKPTEEQIRMMEELLGFKYLDRSMGEL
jgi:hypothetical protein